MSARRIDAQAAARLLSEEGYLYLDVRTHQEFELGHPLGAYNVPLLLMSATGMQPNPEFLRVVQASFALEEKLVIGCKSGARSQQALALLVQAGYTQLVEQRAGYSGQRDPFGRVLERGWQELGLPNALHAAAGRSYAELQERVGK